MIQKLHEEIDLASFDSPDVWKRLSTSALIVFLQMVRVWGLGDDDARGLLGVGNSEVMLRVKRNVQNVQLDGDALMRISCLLGIFKAVNVLLGRELADSWFSLPSDGRSSVAKAH